MKRNVFVFGSIAGIIIAVLMVVSTIMCYNNPDFKGSMIVGYASMLIAFSFIFIGIKNFRDKYNNGVISFGKAFKLGLGIAFIASSVYVLVWCIEYYFFMPDFMEKYSAHVLKQAQESSATAAEIAKQTEEMAFYGEMYKKPWFVILFTYFEVFPLGIVVTLISAAILKKKANNDLTFAEGNRV